MNNLNIIDSTEPKHKCNPMEKSKDQIRRELVTIIFENQFVCFHHFVAYLLDFTPNSYLDCAIDDAYFFATLIEAQGKESSWHYHEYLENCHDKGMVNYREDEE